MTDRSRRNRRESQTTVSRLLGLSPWLLLVAGIVVVALLWWTIERSEVRRVETATEVIGTQLALRLEAWLDDRTTLVHGLAKKWRPAAEEIERRFVPEAQGLLGLYSGFQAINLVDEDGTIKIVVPEEPNLGALGRNLKRHPEKAVRRAFAEATRTGRITCCSVIELLQGGLGIATYKVIYTTNGEVAGYINGVFRIDTLVDTCLAEPELDQQYRFELVSETGRVAYSRGDRASGGEWPYESTIPLRMVDQSWSLRIAPTAAFADVANSSADEVLALAGLLLVGSLVLSLASLLRRQRTIAKSRAKYQLLVEHQIDLVVKVDNDGRFLYVSPSYCDVFGKSEDELLGHGFMPLVHENDRASTAAAMESLSQQPYHVTLQQRTLTRFGWRWLEWSDTAVLDGHDRVVAVIGVGRDITLQKELEAQLRQSQKMQAIGQLAGGVAHDFNNILQAMLGHLEFLDEDLVDADERVRGDLASVQRNAHRAADLTRQLLAFSRQQVLSTSVVDLAGVVTELEAMLRRLLRASIDLRIVGTDAPVHVQCDRSQLEQVVMNLCVNARDAIDDTGVITVTVATRHESETDSFAVLEITDTGHGIDPEIQTRVFEPFFTTKPVGEGTGLGLATVYGIVHQHGGELAVESRLGRGTRFTVTLPLVDELPEEDVEPTPEAIRGGKETILVAEDEPSVLAYTTRLLQSAGYVVVSTCNGEEAVRRHAEAEGAIDLALLDTVMPRLGGRQAAQQILANDPRTAVLLISGYPDVAPVAPGGGPTDSLPQIPALSKPVDGGTLLAHVRELLDRRLSVLSG